MLELRQITKRFGPVVANNGIDLDVRAGEILCLLGENGSGKSTLMNVLSGLYRPDDGVILIDGQPQDFEGPGDAMRRGIGMVHQHFMLIPVFTVAENVMLGHEEAGVAGMLDMEAARQRVREISSRFGFDVDPDELVENLPIGVQQRVEIVKALSRDAQVLILDEPTAVLTPQETDELLAIMRQLRDDGKAIVFVTHKLREVRAVADRVTVLRHGRVVGDALPSASSEELATLMVGRSVALTVVREPAKPRPNGLTVADLSVVDERGRLVVDRASFEVAAGEILAVAGVQGNGQTELAEALVGLQPFTSGSVKLAGQELLGESVADILDSGVGFIPEDRTTDGLVSQFSVAENLILDRTRSGRFVRRGSIRRGELADYAHRMLVDYDIRAPNVEALASHLSGGNQQKVVVARELGRELKLLVASQPTRGVDVGSIEFIHQQIVATRDEGIPVVLVSTELDEILGLGDRIAVMHRGSVLAVVPGGTAREDLGLIMTGELPTPLRGVS